ncbi:NAD-dependent dehydratase [Bacterioplanes sanyensis]|uniref:NAD-dependent dehydratase n=1 Tax=Bacterioplanes sanyensis TaxID=1249553 RepID=A0A222FM93_9GAMM|nr:hypothetical protein [Bacterioplanes sanyensis]ASP39890.1 NAD-dependent dehydratase [Bacterioplanes sanyensis]
MNVLLAGATGLTGRFLLQQCLDSERCTQVFAYCRSQPGIQHSKLTWLSFDRQPDAAIDVFMSTLGTTRKQFGAKGLAYVDHELVLRCAQAAQAAGAGSACILSAVGADAKSLFLYNRIKGDMQRDVAALGFERLALFQPSVLLGQRGEHRPLEHFAGKILSHPGFGRYQALPAEAVAAAMWRAALLQHPGEYFYQVPDIQQLNQSKE